MTNDAPPPPHDREPTVQTTRSSLVGWGLFLLILAGVLLARIFGGGGC